MCICIPKSHLLKDNVHVNHVSVFYVLSFEILESLKIETSKSFPTHALYSLKCTKRTWI